jgi:hypothetical protein
MGYCWADTKELIDNPFGHAFRLTLNIFHLKQIAEKRYPVKLNSAGSLFGKAHFGGPL